MENSKEVTSYVRDKRGEYHTYEEYMYIGRDNKLMIKRERKIDPVAMFWVLVLSFGVKLQRTLVSLKRQYEKNKKINISDGLQKNP